MRAFDEQEFQEEMRRLGVNIRQLKIQYDMFFAGALDREPHELRGRIVKTIKRYCDSPPRAYADRFLLNSLISRYNTMNELWSKTVRSMEEGNRRSLSAAERMGIREQLVTRCLVRDPDKEQESLRRIHGRFLDTARRFGRPEIPFDRFVRGVASQARKLRARAECDQIELRVVVKDDQVQVKARPGKGRAAGRS
jgi:hypothetical protein